MKRWVLPMLVGFIGVLPLVGDVAANRQGMAEIWANLAADTAIAQPLNQIWQKIRTARQATQSGDRPAATAALSQVEDQLNAITDPTRRAQVVAALATTYADLGNNDRAIALVNTLTYDTYAPEYCCISLRAEAEIAIVQAYLRAGQFEPAKQLVLGIQPNSARHQVMVPLIAGLAKQGQFEEAIALRDRIVNDAQEKGRAEFQIVQAYANSRRFEEGLTFVQTINDTTQQANSQVQLIEGALQAGQYDRAERMARQFNVGLTEVAMAAAAVGQQSQALALLSQAYQAAQAQSEQPYPTEWVSRFATIGAYDRALEIATRVDEPYLRGTSMIAIADAYANAGDNAKAFELAQTVQEGTLRPFSDLPDPKLDLLTTLVERTAQTGQYDFALRVVQAFEKPEDRVLALRTIARHYRLNNQPNQATATLLRAVEVAKTVNAVTISIDRNTSYSVSNAPLLINLAQDLAKLENTEAAIATLNQALTAAQQFDYNYNSYVYGTWSSVPLKIEALTQVARAYQELGQAPRAVPVLQEALQLTPTIEDLQVRLERLVAIAQGLAAADELEQARQVLALAQSATEPMTEPQQQLWALRTIAQGYAAMNQPQAMSAIINQALPLIATLDPAQQDAQYQQLAIALASANNPDLALSIVERIQDYGAKMDAMIRSAAHYLQSNQPESATRMLSQLQAVSDQAWGIDRGDIRLNEQITNYYVTPGYWRHPLWHYELATRLNERIQSPIARASTAATIAIGYAAQEEPERAREMLTTAIAMVRTIESVADQQTMLWQAFEQAMQAKQLDLALVIANAFEGAPYRSNTLRRVAHQYFLLGQPDRAATTLSQAQQAASQIADRAEREQVLQAIAQQLLRSTDQ